VKGWRKRLIQRWHEEQAKQKQEEERQNTTIEQAWQRCKVVMIPQTAAQFQVDEIRKAFMAGASVMFVTMMKNAQQPMAQAMDATKATEDDIYRELSAYATKPEARN